MNVIFPVILIFNDDVDEAQSFKLGDTSDNLSLNSALVVATSDLEETFISPILIPTVGNQPIGGSTLYTPTNNLDGVSSEG